MPKLIDAHVLRDIPPEAMEKLDAILLRDGLPRVVPSLQLQAFPSMALSVYGVKRGIYQYITVELVDYLRELIGDAPTIEICAGHGTLGRELGIPTTDNHMQTRAGIRAYYEFLGQTVIAPPPDVEKLEALEAVEKYRPDTVIAAFATQKHVEGDEHGSIYGVNEFYMLGRIRRYILIGNVNVHGQKRIMNRPHQTIAHPDMLYTRCFDQSLNRIWIWEA